MKLYNNGRRVINPNTPQAHAPGKWLEVDDAEGKRLLKLFPRDLTTNAAAEAAEAAARAERAKLSAENEELKAKLAKYEAQLASLEQITTAPSSDLSAQPIVTPQALKAAVAAPKGKK